MDFFARQEKARRHTKLLVFYFVVAVALIVLTVYLGTAVIFLNSRHAEAGPLSWWNPRLFLGVAAATLLVIIGGSVAKTAALAQGGSAVAQMLGGRRINSNTQDPDERKLLNVVEEMAIASGTPVPDVYVLPEDAINAFAAGRSPSDATISVTKGGMRLLTRDELQGVIGHEFSHILNGDMRLNLRLIGIVSGILCLTIIGRILLRTRGRRNPLPLLGLVLIVIGFIGVIFGRLIKSAISRQREFLADASSVQFTRNPEGLAGALKKIGGLAGGSRLQTKNAEEASHMFFANGLADSWTQLMATHPPLDERIRAIEPSWDGRYPAVVRPTREPLHAAPAVAARPPATPTIVRTPDDLRRTPWAAAAAPPPIPAQAIVSGVGTPATRHLVYAAQFRENLPEVLTQAAREPMSATALICALLLSSDDAARAKQLAEFQGGVAPAIGEETQRLHHSVASLPTSAKLPLAMLAMPALRRLSHQQFADFTSAIRTLVQSNGEIDLFEYTLQKMVLRHLEPHFEAVVQPAIRFFSLEELQPECSILLSALALLGQDDKSAMEKAFGEGVQQLHRPDLNFRLLEFSACGLPQVDAALNRFAQAAAQIKKCVLAACAATVAADGVIRPDEAELLRAVADTLDCPIPPFVEVV